MKDYKRLTEQYYPCLACENGKCLEPRYDCKEKEECEAWNRLFELEDKIESGELCDREEVKKEEEVEQIVKERDEYKHRAEVAEMALQIADELGELCGRKEDYVQQAEKELQEERKGDA